MKPKPDFTIEELLKEAITRKDDQADVFRATDLADLWGIQSAESVFRRMDELQEVGWRFEPTKKRIRDRAGRETTTQAYRVIPPLNEETPL